MDEILNSILPSLESTTESVEKIMELESQETPEFVDKLLEESGNKLEDVSLLNLKNDAMISYIHNVTLIILSHLERLRSENDGSNREKAIESTIVQRTTLERGIKPLEKKLSYQLDKMIRSYNKMLTDFENEDKINDETNDNDSNDSQENDSESEEESADELSYRPDASSLIKAPMKKTSKTSNQEEEAYKPPKVNAVAPPTAPSDDKPRSNKKLQSMEEYLRETSDLPQEEKSIGVDIVNHGRGGVKTDNERRKELEIQTYEEENFTRLPATMTKKDKRQKRKQLYDTFGGEDFSMFNNTTNLSDSTSRKRKSKSVWDKVKRRK